MDGNDLSTKLSTGCGERTFVVVWLSTGGDAAGRSASQGSYIPWARDGVDILASLSGAVPAWNRHCQKLTVFSPGANSSATLPRAKFCADSLLVQSFLMSVTIVVGVM